MDVHKINIFFYIIEINNQEFITVLPYATNYTLSRVAYQDIVARVSIYHCLYTYFACSVLLFEIVVEKVKFHLNALDFSNKYVSLSFINC